MEVIKVKGGETWEAADNSIKDLERPLQDTRYKHKIPDTRYKIQCIDIVNILNYQHSWYPHSKFSIAIANFFRVKMRNDIPVHHRILIRKWEILFAVVFRICICSCICICGLYLNFLFGIFYLKLYLASHFPDNFNAIWLEITKLFNNHGGRRQIPELTLRGTRPITTSPGFQ